MNSNDIKLSKIFAPRKKSPLTVDPILIGDWLNQGLRFRFSYDGSLSVVIIAPYSIAGGQVLSFESESYIRQSGSQGLQGTWRKVFDTGETLDLTFGPYGFYSFVWNDGFCGGHFYSEDGTTLSIVETRSFFDCIGNRIRFTSIDGTVMDNTYQVVGDTLSLTTPEGVFTYTRIPF